MSNTVPLRHATFRSDDYAAEQAEAAYQYLFAATAKVVPLASPFFVEIASHRTPRMSFHFMESVPFDFRRTAEKIGFDAIDAIVVQHVEAVEADGDFDGRRIRAGVGSLYCIDFARPSFIRDAVPAGGERAKRNFVGMDRALATRWFGPLHDLHGLVVEPGRAAAYVAQLARLRSWLPGRKVVQARLIEETAALLSQTIKWADRSLQDREVKAALAFDRACLHVQSNLGRRDLSAAIVADAIGVSRSKLFEMFKPHGGVERYIWGQRLENARMAVAHSSDVRRMADLAITFGFRDGAQLSRMFRRRYGLSPSGMRAAASPLPDGPLDHAAAQARQGDGGGPAAG